MEHRSHTRQKNKDRKDLLSDRIDYSAGGNDENDRVHFKDAEKLAALMESIPWSEKTIDFKIGKKIDQRHPLYPLYQLIQSEKEEAARQSSKKLADSQAKLDLILDVSKVASWEAYWQENGDSYFIFNDQFYSLYRTTAELEGGYRMSAMDYAHRFIHPDDIVIPAENVHTLEDLHDLHIEDSGEVEHRIIRRDGQIRHIAVRYIVIRDAEGRPLRKIGANQDITDQKEIEEKLRAAKQQAELANQSKSVFLANMSHEIRTPMNGILGTLQLLHDSPLNQEQSAYAETAIMSTRRLNKLLSDILDMSKVEAGKMKICSEPFSLQESLKEILQLFTPAARSQGISLEGTIDQDIPSRVFGDGIRFQQILGNLIGNAIKFTKFGVVSVKIQSLHTCSDQECRILCSVSDTGVGISDSFLSKLFTPFSQEMQWKKINSQGTGLGLTISKQLVSLMGGNMAVESTEGLGSTFHFCLPFTPVNYVVPAQKVKVAETMPEGLKILLAEDDSISRMLAATFLKKLHYSVHPVENGIEAIEALRNESFDLAIFDVYMPELDGIETTQAIRNGRAGVKRQDIPIIAMTACSMTGDKQRFKDAGMNGYVAKPIESSELKNEISRLFKNER